MTVFGSIKLMLSIEETRKILGDKVRDLPDEKVAEIRDSTYQLVEIILDEYFKEIGSEHEQHSL